MEYYLWLDIETTGLDEKQNKILEVACIITDRIELNKPLYSNSWVAWCPDWRDLANDYVTKMHEKSGLASLLDSGAGKRTDQIEKNILNVVNSPPHTFYLAGSSVQFDRRWIIHHMPLLAGRLHYRQLDVTTLKLAFGPWSLPKPQKTHRALDDLHESIGVLKHYRDYLAFDPTELP